MMSLKEIKEMFENKNIQFYEVEIPVEKIKNGIRFYDLSSFYEFVHKQKIDVVFGFEYYDEPYSYLITDDIIERIVNQYTYFNIIDLIKKDIEKHNQEILKFNLYIDSLIRIIYHLQYYHKFMGMYIFILLNLY